MLGCAAFIAFAIEGWSPQPHVDDAFISYRYAHNLVEGRGLVFNAGEYVEGITNLLWTLLIAGGMYLQIGAETAGHWLGWTSGLAVLALTYWYAIAKVEASLRWIGALAPWIVLTSRSFPLWALSGMETGLFTAFVVGTLLCAALEKERTAMFLAACATWTRPEGAIVATIVAGFLVVRSGFLNRRVWIALSIYLIPVALLTAFRLAYYGSPVPNTFYAKVGDPNLGWAAHYIRQFFFRSGALLAVPVVVGVFLDRRTWPGAAYVGVSLAYVFLVGGDAFPYGRFLLPTLAVMAALSVRGIVAAVDRHVRYGVLLAAPVLALLMWHVFGFSAAGAALGLVIGAAAGVLLWNRRRLAVAAFVSVFASVFLLSKTELGAVNEPVLRSRNDAVAEVRKNWNFMLDRKRKQSEKLSALSPKPKLVATVAVGALGYYSNLPMLDLVGITSREIARHSDKAKKSTGPPGHRRSYADYVLKQEPDYIVIVRREPRFAISAIADLKAHPGFQRDYRWDENLDCFKRVK